MGGLFGWHHVRMRVVVPVIWHDGILEGQLFPIHCVFDSLKRYAVAETIQYGHTLAAGGDRAVKAQKHRRELGGER
jgi:hypothetical protein